MASAYRTTEGAFEPWARLLRPKADARTGQLGRLSSTGIVCLHLQPPPPGKPSAGRSLALDIPHQAIPGEPSQRRSSGTRTDRASAVADVRSARNTGSLSLAAVQAFPARPFKPAALLCAAVTRPELAAKLLRGQARTARKASSSPRTSSIRPAGPVAHQAGQVAT